ncbi:hypothetical protein ACHAW6_002593 [Cyclotella cf. meneghiniana]
MACRLALCPQPLPPRVLPDPLWTTRHQTSNPPEPRGHRAGVHVGHDPLWDWPHATLRRSDPSVLQPWYLDIFALQGPSSCIVDLFHMLCHHCPSMGYFPKPEKCWVICPPSSEPHPFQVFNDASLPVSYCHRRQYVGRFVGSCTKRDEWLSPMIQKWVTGIKRLAAIATRFPHSAYAGLVSCLSAEWQYICRTVTGIGPSLTMVENALHTKFLPAVLSIDGPIDDELRTLLGNGVKTGGLEIRDPTLTAASLYSTSVEATDMLAGTLIQNKPINVEAHQNCVRAAGVTYRKTGAMSKSPSTLPSWNGRRQKSKNEWSMPQPLVRGSQSYRTDSLGPNLPKMSGSIMMPSDMANALHTYLTSVTAAALASCWSMDSAARKAGLSASTTMMCATNGPTYAAFLSPTCKS